jgi:hypothetical protein
MAVMAARALAFTGKRTDGSDSADSRLENFGDREEISAWARASIAGLVRSGMLTGISDDRLAPQDKVTRAQAAAVLKRLLQAAGFID